MSVRCLLTLGLTASLLGRLAAAGFCMAQRTLLAAAEDSFVLGRQRSCGIRDRWLSEHETADILYQVHDLAHSNGTSLAAWLQIAGLGNTTTSSASVATVGGLKSPSAKVSSGSLQPPAGWRWDWWVSNMTATERRFQQRISSVLVRPLVKFSSRLGSAAPPAKLSALLRELLAESRPAVLAALRQVNGNGSLERLLSRDGSVVSTLSSAITELVVLTSGASRQMRWAAAPYLKPTNTSSPSANNATSSTPNTPPTNTSATSPKPLKSSTSPSSNNTSSPASSPSKVALMSRAFRSLSVSAPYALGAGTLITVVSLVIASLCILFGVPAALLMAVTLYSGILLAGTLARGLVGGEVAELEAGLLLGRATEAVLGGLFRMKLLRTLLMFVLEGLAG